MFRLLPFILLLNPLLGHSELQTEYVWVKSKKSFFQGKCYEIDSQSHGKKYKGKVESRFCNPKNYLYYFLPEQGKCFIVDELTNGKAFATKADIKNCRPEQTINIFASFYGKHGCYEVDKKTKGKSFFYRLSEKDCDGSDKKYFFKLEKNRTGKCFTKNATEIVKVNLKFCRPQKPVYKHYRVSPLKGQCFEQDPRGEEYYSKKTSIKMCRPIETIFVFYMNPKNNNSKCYELDKETKGDNYLNIVPHENCKN